MYVFCGGLFYETCFEVHPVVVCFNLYSYLWVNSIPLYKIYHRLLMQYWAFGLFLPFAITNNTNVNICGRFYLGVCFHFLWI